MDNIPPGATVLFVGDPFQLPPVNELPGVNLAAADAQLLRVHRQAQDNPVLQLATATRDGGWSPWLMKYDNANPLLQKAYGAQGMLDQATNLFKVDSDAIILCYTNARRNAFNADIRNQLGFTKAIEAGDRMIVRMNNKRSGVMNGEIFKVEKVKNYTSAKYGKYAIVTFEGRKTPFKIKLRFLGKSRNDYWNWAKAQHKLPKNFIHADHAYAITIHSSQGSEYEHVFYFWEEAQTRLFYQDAPTCQAMAYTGFTRSFKHLYVYR
jgi:exodeoxyribonuclease-5